MTDLELINYFVSNAKHMMWFLGAGTSRSAGLPTATDITWDLKLRLYCQEENQDIKTHDITTEIIKNRVQAYMDSKGYPAIWSPEEYSFYFERTFGDDYGAQQRYLVNVLSNDRVSLNVGHKAFAGLIAQNSARLIFTTNFDDVIELAYAKVSGRTLQSFNLEGSYAALDALNSERFPIYAKIHGDFKYRSVKNLSADLIENDKKIQQCFLAAAIRFGLIVSGYSGRDNNVMSMFHAALEQNNAFPFGIFWTVPSCRGILSGVEEFIEKAKGKGVNAHIVEAGTFDSMLSKMWRQLDSRNPTFDAIIRNERATSVNIRIGSGGTGFPIIRTNALLINEIPTKCVQIITKSPFSSIEIKNRLKANPNSEIVARLDKILAWGNPQRIRQIIGEDEIESHFEYQIANPIELITRNKGYHSFYQRALVVSIIDGTPIQLRNNKGFFLCIDPHETNHQLFDPLKKALMDRRGNWGKLSGIIPSSTRVLWQEAVSAKLEVKNNKLWLILRPTLWIEPREERRNYKEFIRTKRRGLFNRQANDILDAWISILFNNPSKGSVVSVSSLEDEEFPVQFKISTRTAFSRK